MFALVWTKTLLKLLRDHTVEFSAVVSATSVALGLLFQLVYFRHLGIPIAQFSSMEDFAATGTQSLFLFPTVAVVIVVVLVLVCLVVLPLLGAVQLGLRGLSFLIQVVLFATIRAFLYAYYLVSMALVWVVWRTTIFVQLLGKRFPLSNHQTSDDAPSDATDRYRKKLEVVSETYNNRVGALDRTFVKIETQATKFRTWLKESTSWNNANRHLSSDSATNMFIFVTVLVVLLASWATATFAGSHVLKEYGAAPGDAAPPSAIEQGASQPSGVSAAADDEGEASRLLSTAAEFYLDLVQPYALVEVSFRDRAEAPIPMVQLGRTSHYFFLLYREGQNVGDVVVVPRDEVRGVVLMKSAEQGSPGQPESKDEPVSPPVLSRVSLEIVNRLELRPEAVDVAGRERVVAVLMFDADADAKAWFSETGYRDCEVKGSRAICVATRKTGYESPYKESLINILRIAHICGSGGESAKLRAVGYASSSSASIFFDGADAQELISQSEAREDFEGCREGLDDRSIAFNRCVARDRAEGVSQMLDYLLDELGLGGKVEDERTVKVDSKSAESRSGMRTTFPDVDVTSGTYNRDVGRLNRRVDLILEETPSCKFVDET